MKAAKLKLIWQIWLALASQEVEVDKNDGRSLLSVRV